MSRTKKLLLVLFAFILINCNKPQIQPKSPPVQATSGSDGVTLGTTDQENSEVQGSDPSDTVPPTAEASSGLSGGVTGDKIPILPAGSNIMIFEIQMVNDLVGWAVGGVDIEEEHILKTEDGGSTWQDVTPPQPVITDHGNYSTANLGTWDGNNAWVNYTGSNLIWTTKNGGINWEAKPLSYTTNVEAMFAVLDQNHVWIFQFLDSGMHKVYTALVKTQNGGDSWELILDPYQDVIIQSFYKTGSVFIDPQSGWLTKNFDGVSPYLHLVKTMDGGITWETQDIIPPPSLPNIFNEGACGLYDPYLFAPDVGYFRLSCIYYENDQRKEEDFLYRTDKGGMSWDILDTPGGEIYYLNEYIIYSLGKDIERSTDGGQNWQFVKTVNWEGQFSFIDQNTAWVVAADKSDWENPIYALVKTTNGCSSFEAITPALVTSQTQR